MGKISPSGILAETYRNAFQWIHLFMPIALVSAIIGILLNQAFLDSMVINAEANSVALPENFWTIWSIIMLGTTIAQFIQLSIFDFVMDRREDWLRFGIVRAVRRMAFVLIGMVIYGVAYFVGGMLLFIPGVMAMFLLMMMGPLILIDSVGPFEAIGKSWRLTWGNAWRLAGAAILTFVPVTLVFWPAGTALGIISFDMQQATAAPAMPWTNWQTWVWLVLSAAMSVIATSFYLVAFRALKTAKADSDEVLPEMVSA